MTGEEIVQAVRADLEECGLDIHEFDLRSVVVSTLEILTDEGLIAKLPGRPDLRMVTT